MQLQNHATVLKDEVWMTTKYKRFLKTNANSFHVDIYSTAWRTVSIDQACILTDHPINIFDR